MAWKVYGFMEGRDGNPKKRSGEPTIYGPLPRKRWIPETGKRNKMPRLPKINPKATGERAKDVTARMAVEYARWLAARDGVIIPADTKGVALWAHGKIEDRVSAVAWHHAGTYAANRGSALARIDIPNWDFVPMMPVEEIVPAHEAFDSLASAGWAILLQAA